MTSPCNRDEGWNSIDAFRATEEGGFGGKEFCHLVCVFSIPHILVAAMVVKYSDMYSHFIICNRDNAVLLSSSGYFQVVLLFIITTLILVIFSNISYQQLSNFTDEQ